MGLQKILSLLEAEDSDVRVHAVKVVANLAAEGVYCFYDYCQHMYPQSSEINFHIIFCLYFSGSHKKGAALLIYPLLCSNKSGEDSGSWRTYILVNASKKF